MRGARVVLGMFVVAAAAVLPVDAAALPGLPPVGPDVPTASAPVASVKVFDDERWSYEEGAHSRTFDLPAVAWDRVVLELSSRPEGDPWDRLFGVAIEGAEVLRGTTPRAAFTINKDVTKYSGDWPATAATMDLFAGTWVGALRFSAVLHFYDDPATAPLVDAAVAQVASPVRWSYLNGAGNSAAGPVLFGSTTPASVQLELYTSGHSQTGEFWWMEADPAATPRFELLVDGYKVGDVTALPYVYALLGFNGTLGALHPLLWWTAPQVLDIAGVHGGIGEIPPYVVDVDPALLPLFKGARDVSVKQTSGLAVWVTSLTILAE